MPIEIESRRLKKNELPDTLKEMFSSTSEWESRHMDKKQNGVLFSGEKERKIPFFKMTGVLEREELRKDFESFLSKNRIDTDKDGNQFLFLEVLLGVNEGRVRSYFVSDYKQLEKLAKRYAEETKDFVLLVSHFAERTKDNSAMVEHAHLLYRNPFGATKDTSLEEFLESEYEED